MKFKMIAFKKCGEENDIQRFMSSYIGKIEDGMRYRDNTSFKVSLKQEIIADGKLPHIQEIVNVLELEDICGIPASAFDACGLRSLSRCAWSFRYGFKNYGGAEPEFVTIYSNGKCLFDKEIEDYNAPIEPLEYYFGKDNLADFLIKRAAGMDIKIDPRYDPEKPTPPSLRDMMMPL